MKELSVYAETRWNLFFSFCCCCCFEVQLNLGLSRSGIITLSCSNPITFFEVGFLQDFRHKYGDLRLDLAGQFNGTASVCIGFNFVCFVPGDFVSPKVGPSKNNKLIH